MHVCLSIKLDKQKWLENIWNKSVTVYAFGYLQEQQSPSLISLNSEWWICQKCFKYSVSPHYKCKSIHSSKASWSSSCNVYFNSYINAEYCVIENGTLRRLRQETTAPLNSSHSHYVCKENRSENSSPDPLPQSVTTENRGQRDGSQFHTQRVT